jgi:uncharacterized membrane protein YesL
LGYSQRVSPFFALRKVPYNFTVLVHFANSITNPIEHIFFNKFIQLSCNYSLLFNYAVAAIRFMSLTSIILFASARIANLIIAFPICCNEQILLGIINLNNGINHPN